MPKGVYVRTKPAKRSRRPEIERFNEKWTPEPMSGCWLWTAGVSSLRYASPGMGAYGRFSMGTGDTTFAHRAAWRLLRGPIADGLCVLHNCDNPACVNPDHLRLGPIEENVADRMKRGRHVPVKGALNGNAKLTTDAVRAMRAAYAAGGRSQLAIARLFGVTQATVHRAVAGKSWT